MGSSSSFWNIAYQQAMKSGVLVAKVYSFLHVTTNYLAFPAYAFGPSMIPTLHPSGNVVLAERISTRSRKLSRGDVVVLQSPEDPNKTPIKRVIGLEGDCVSFVADPEKSDESRTIVVPKGHVWVQGDYTQNSRDSRMYGPLPYGLIQGRVLWRMIAPKWVRFAPTEEVFDEFPIPKLTNDFEELQENNGDLINVIDLLDGEAA